MNGVGLFLNTGQAACDYLGELEDDPSVTATASEALGLMLMQIGQTKCPNCYDCGIDACITKKVYHTQCDTVYIQSHQPIVPIYTITVEDNEV